MNCYKYKYNGKNLQEKYIINYGKLIIIFIFIFSSCKEETCESARDKENEYHFNIISLSSYKDNFNQDSYFEIRGINPETKNNIFFKDDGRWISTYSDSIEKGDTLYKKKGDDFFLIKKKNSLIKIYTLKCNPNGVVDKTSPKIEVIDR